MIGALLNLLAEAQCYPVELTTAGVNKALEKFFDQAIEQPEEYTSKVQRLNQLFHLDLATVNTQVDPEYSGPFCERLGTVLESRCQLRKCPNHTEQHRWNCCKLGDPRQDLPSSEISHGLRGLTSKVDISIGTQLPPHRIYCTSITCCMYCGKPANKKVTDSQVCCEACLKRLPGKAVQANLEARYGVPAKELLEYTIKRWHSLQEQSQALGVPLLDLQSIFAVFCIDPKQYKTIEDRRFVNPFYTRKRGRPVIDGILYRLFAEYAGYRKTQKIRPSIEHLNTELLSQANGFLSDRSLMNFNLVQTNF